MTNNVTGLTALIIAITGLVTALGTVIGIIAHLRGHNVKSQAAAQQPPPASAYDLSAENEPMSPDTPGPWTKG